MCGDAQSGLRDGGVVHLLAISAAAMEGFPPAGLSVATAAVSMLGRQTCSMPRGQVKLAAFGFQGQQLAFAEGKRLQ